MVVDLPWWQPYLAQFQALAQVQRLPQGILLAAPHGCGQEICAKYMAKSLLGVSAKQRQLLVAGTHPDLLEIVPEGASSQIKVDMIRDCRAFLQNCANQAGYRVVIIQGADRLNVAAANALLKSLEEPGEQTLFILTVSQLDKVLPTIRSRCQVWSLTLTHAQIEAWLNAQISAKDMKQWLPIFKSSPLSLQAWLTETPAAERDKYLKLAQRFLKPFEPFKAIAWAQDLDLNIMLTLLMVMLRDLAMCFEGVAEAQLAFPQFAYSGIQALPQAPTAIFETWQTYSELKQQLATSASLNKRLCWAQLVNVWQQAFWR